jgi:hypothetical protein
MPQWQRGAFPTPALSWGRKLFYATAKPKSPVGLKGYLKTQIPAGNIPGTEFLKKSAGCVILNNVILNEKTLSVFFDKLAGFSMSFGTKASGALKSPSNTNMPKASTIGVTMKSKLTSVPNPSLPYTQHTSGGGIGNTIVQNPIPKQTQQQPMPVQRMV